MKKLAMLLVFALIAGLLGGCAKTDPEPAPEPAPAPEPGPAPETEEPDQGNENNGDSPNSGVQLADGTYKAKFDTDSSMFHVNESCDGMGDLTVKDGKMMIHISLVSKKIVNLYPGLAEDAKKDGAELLQPTIDTVTYSDGMSEEVYGFDVPVPALDQEFDLAIIGEAGKWYDHKVSVSDPVLFVEDGDYTAEVTMTGGSGKAHIESPAVIHVEDGVMTAEIVWSSEHYEYMTVGDVQYDRINDEGNSVMIIPITLDEDIEVSALTTAMSEPHLIDYVLHFDGATLKKG